MQPDDQSNPQDDSLIPSQDTVTPNEQDVPAAPTDNFQVPQDLANAGQNTNEPRATDSPESLDQDLSESTNREDIDPQHSINRPEGINSDVTEDN